MQQGNLGWSCIATVWEVMLNPIQNPDDRYTMSDAVLFEATHAQGPSDTTRPGSTVRSWLAEAGPRRTGQMLQRAVSDRKWLWVMTAVFVGLGLVYMFFWNPLVHHSESWATGGDLWGIFRGAQYVSWGSLGGI